MATIAIGAVLGAATAVVLVSGPSPPHRTAIGNRGVVTTNHPAAPATSTPPTTAPPTTVPPTATTDPGNLPQTDTFPSSSSPQFEAAMAALWQGVVSGSSAAAGPAFFPESAYVQLKSIAGPESDYTNRLLVDFAADLDAAHAQLGPNGATASLVSVNVPQQYGHWIPPWVCDNRVGYYEVANSRVVYQEAGQVRSFGIASLISWRGEWYVVHLGAILRSTSGGVVEDPEVGPGTSPDSTTC